MSTPTGLTSHPDAPDCADGSIARGITSPARGSFHAALWGSGPADDDEPGGEQTRPAGRDLNASTTHRGQDAVVDLALTHADVGEQRPRLLGRDRFDADVPRVPADDAPRSQTDPFDSPLGGVDGRVAPRQVGKSTGP